MDFDEMRELAHERIAGRRGMLLDGDPIEELARAHERHAERLDRAADGLREVGWKNALGDTVEGRTVTTNYRASATAGPQSLRAALISQADASRAIAEGLRAVHTELADTEKVGYTQIYYAAQHSTQAN
ncbi:hypothetical protein [Tsukamurella soli]